MKQKILDLLQDYFVDESLVAEITAVLDAGETNPEKQVRLLCGGSGSIFMLDTKQVKQSDIRDWATLNGYALVKICSMADKLKIEKVAREIWGDAEGDKYFLE